MKRFAIRFLMMCFSVALPLAHAGHHETSEPAIQYVLTQGYKAADAPATAAAAGEFLKSGALASRGVGMGLYSLDAVTSHGATVSMEYYYPTAASLPPPSVQTASGPHVDFFGAMRELDNELVFSYLQKTLVEVIPPETVNENKSFYIYYLSVSDPATYAMAWKKLMKTLAKDGVAPKAYGLRSIMAGGENGETHMIWMGYPSMTALVEGFDATNAHPALADFRASMAGKRTVTRTVMSNQMALDAAGMFD
jgi:hypothetical protein